MILPLALLVAARLQVLDPRGEPVERYVVFDEAGVAHPVDSNRGAVRLPVQQVQVFAAGYEGPVTTRLGPGRNELVLSGAPRELLGVGVPSVDARTPVARVYPLNGVVENQSSAYVLVHDCDSGELRTLGPDEGTGAWTEDFDYLSTDRGRTWRKLGAHRVVLVDQNLDDPGLCTATLCRPCR